MKLTGYDGFDWEDFGYSVGIPDDLLLMPTVEPITLERPGTFPTFGPSVIGAMVLPATAMILPENTQGGFEPAWLYFFKRINPYDTRPRQLRGLRNDGVTVVTIDAKLRILARSGTQERNTRRLDFVAVQPWFESQATLSQSGTF